MPSYLNCERKEPSAERSEFLYYFTSCSTCLLWMHIHFSLMLDYLYFVSSSRINEMNREIKAPLSFASLGAGYMLRGYFSYNIEMYRILYESFSVSCISVQQSNNSTLMFYIKRLMCFRISACVVLDAALSVRCFSKNKTHDSNLQFTIVISNGLFYVTIYHYCHHHFQPFPTIYNIIRTL